MDYSSNILEIIESGRHQLSTIKPSDWAEKYRTMDSSVSRYRGRFSYDVTPYTRDIVDCLAPDHPARIVSVMKAAQIGFSTGVIESGIGYIISEQPGNILLLTGHSDLSEEAIEKIDKMIDSCGIRHLIRSTIKRAKNQKSGDTNTKKEFPGGGLVAGSASNHKLLRQRSVAYAFIDDFEAAKGKTSQSGNTRKMIEARLAAYYDKMKLFYISTPELKATSNIEPVYLQGDQRKWNIPCQACGEYIPLEWEIEMDGQKEKAGIYYKLDNHDKLIESSVGYICQKCGGFFTDSNKYEFNLMGKYVPTAEPLTDGHFSFHINALYAPPGMYDWKHYVRDYLEANPVGQPRDEELHQTFVNLCLGQTYEPAGESPKASELMRNIREYEPETVPEALSIKDGNGRIVLLTCAADMNGVVDDARLDYEILAHSESGSVYSILHGSIGTFIPNQSVSQKDKDVTRERWSYDRTKENNVWKEFDRVLNTIYKTDTGRNMKVFVSGLDTGYYEHHAFEYIDNTNHEVVGLKGEKLDKYSPINADIRRFKVGQSRSKLYILRVNQIKDDLSYLIKLNWDRRTGENQPPGMLNFPINRGNLYQFHTYFEQFESEHKIYDKNGNYIWQKKTSTSQNHFWDCRIYNMAMRDILLFMIAQKYKAKEVSWEEYCKLVLPSK